MFINIKIDHLKGTYISGLEFAVCLFMILLEQQSHKIVRILGRLVLLYFHTMFQANVSSIVIIFSGTQIIQMPIQTHLLYR